MKEFLTRPGWSVLDRLAAVVGVLCVLFFMMTPVVGRVEGRIAPVVSDFQIESVRGVHKSNITGSFRINRLGCTFIRLDWFLVGHSREVLVDVKFESGSRVRGENLQTFGPWLIDVPPDSLSDYTRADVVHQCPGRPWVTVTSIYPPSKD